MAATKLLIPLEPQPDFPHADLCDKNADMLGLMLSNRELIQRGHLATEDIYKFFKLDHPAILRGVERAYEGSDRHDAVSHGIALFESSVGFIGDLPPGCTDEIYKWAYAVSHHMDDDDFAKYMDKSLEAFNTKMPKMVEVTQEAAARYYPHLTGYAILGAAMSRQLALDSTAKITY